MKILLAIDGSEYSMAAVDEAARLPWPENTSLKLLSVAELPRPVMAGPLPVPGNYLAEWEKALEEQAVANTAKALSRYYEKNGSKLEVTARTVKGDPKDVILNESANWGADLILIGTHGYNLLERMWLGSVSRTVATHAPCSVEIVRARTNTSPAYNIILAVDGSECSDLAVEEVAIRPWPATTEVRIISAIHLPFTPTPETWSLPESYFSQVEKSARELAATAIDRAFTRLSDSNNSRATPLKISKEGVVGHAEDVIIKTARDWGADLILLGSHGYRGVNRFLLGSVSQAVAYHAPCSVQIVRARKTV